MLLRPAVSAFSANTGFSPKDHSNDSVCLLTAAPRWSDFGRSQTLTCMSSAVALKDRPWPGDLVAHKFDPRRLSIN
jgi:hypothetical protein